MCDLIQVQAIFLFSIIWNDCFDDKQTMILIVGFSAGEVRPMVLSMCVATEQAVVACAGWLPSQVEGGALTAGAPRSCLRLSFRALRLCSPGAPRQPQAQDTFSESGVCGPHSLSRDGLMLPTFIVK